MTGFLPSLFASNYFESSSAGDNDGMEGSQDEIDRIIM